MSLVLSDPPSERAILAGICQYGSDAYLDIADIVQETTFTDETNSIIFRCLKHIFEKDSESKIDIALIHAASNEVGLSYTLTKKADVQYLQALFQFPVNISNVRKFAAKIRKLEIAKLLHTQLAVAQDKLLDIKGDEAVSQILGIAEDTVFDFTSLLNDQENTPVQIGNDVDEYVDFLANNPVQQIGISTGFPAYDQAIGGGLRKSTINVIASRAKGGKSLMIDNMGYNIAKSGIPVLNLDTEMVREDHVHRMLAMLSGVSINKIETGQFSKEPYARQKIDKIKKEFKEIPFYYKSIAGKSFEDQLSVMRRWLLQVVGLNEDGTAKPCVILYDYIKLMDTQGMKDLKEYQLLGFLMTSLHNFANRYQLPILATLQLNRDGITKESTDVASGSDRIIWLCSNFSIFKAKSDEELAEDGPKNGNRKLITVVARHGPGMEYGNYINCHIQGWCAKVTEGKTKFELSNIKENEGFIVEDDKEPEQIKFESR